tara:strand:+ start:694 stop:1032 length:339 start_codon:yes stop_codon:yes gene_type:complete
MNMNRKQRRAMAAAERKLGNDDMAAKVALFGKLPEECTACTTAFDKQNREMVTSWNVVVREEENKVNLYCPTCWDTAQDVIANFLKEMEELQEAPPAEEQEEEEQEEVSNES